MRQAAARGISLRSRVNFARRFWIRTRQSHPYRQTNCGHRTRFKLASQWSLIGVIISHVIVPFDFIEEMPAKSPSLSVVSTDAYTSTPLLRLLRHTCYSLCISTKSGSVSWDHCPYHFARL
jgi:hypothetical protein